MVKVFSSPFALKEFEGQSLGETEWIEITQERINLFADATGDHQWVHVDPERAQDGPFGACIAHGYLSLSLINLFLPQIIDVQGISMGVNYGCNKVRFPSPVIVGSKVRGVAELLQVEEIKGTIQAIIQVTVEIEGKEKPACVVETISRYYPEQTDQK